MDNSGERLILVDGRHVRVGRQTGVTAGRTLHGMRVEALILVKSGCYISLPSAASGHKIRFSQRTREMGCPSSIYFPDREKNLAGASPYAAPRRPWPRRR